MKEEKKGIHLTDLLNELQHGEKEPGEKKELSAEFLFDKCFPDMLPTVKYIAVAFAKKYCSLSHKEAEAVEWISLEVEQPAEKETVWACDIENRIFTVSLSCLVR